MNKNLVVIVVVGMMTNMVEAYVWRVHNDTADTTIRVSIRSTAAWWGKKKAVIKPGQSEKFETKGECFKWLRVRGVSGFGAGLREDVGYKADSCRSYDFHVSMPNEMINRALLPQAPIKGQISLTECSQQSQTPEFMPEHKIKIAVEKRVM